MPGSGGPSPGVTSGRPGSGQPQPKLGAHFQRSAESCWSGRPPTRVGSRRIGVGSTTSNSLRPIGIELSSPIEVKAGEDFRLIKQLAEDEAIAEADTLLLTVPNQLGVDYNAHVIEAILKHVAPALGWR